jgi:hypothetical protein
LAAYPEVAVSRLGPLSWLWYIDACCWSAKVNSKHLEDRIHQAPGKLETEWFQNWPVWLHWYQKMMARCEEWLVIVGSLHCFDDIALFGDLVEETAATLVLSCWARNRLVICGSWRYVITSFYQCVGRNKYVELRHWMAKKCTRLGGWMGFL